MKRICIPEIVHMQNGTKNNGDAEVTNLARSEDPRLSDRDVVDAMTLRRSKLARLEGMILDGERGAFAALGLLRTYLEVSHPALASHGRGDAESPLVLVIHQAAPDEAPIMGSEDDDDAAPPDK